jgi:uncharacterized integral membrane protein
MNSLKRQIRGLSIGLVVEFVLGIMLASVAARDDLAAHQSLAHNLILGLHMLIGLALMLGSIMLAVSARKYILVHRWLVAGCVAIITAFGAGMTVVAFNSSWGVLVMGIGFILALWLFNRSYSLLSNNVTDKQVLSSVEH